MSVKSVTTTTIRCDRCGYSEERSECTSSFSQFDNPEIKVKSCITYKAPFEYDLCENCRVDLRRWLDSCKEESK